MSWALSLPTETLKDSSARHVLLCLANYAGSNGTGAFPSASTLAQDTGLSERTVRYKLDDLEQFGLIQKGNQAIAAVHIDRHDRRPVVYDLQIFRGANPAPRTKRGADDATGCNPQQNGVQSGTERGAAAAPNPSLNHQGTEEQLQQREIQSALDEQNRAAVEPQDDRQRFAMFATWAPNEKALSDQIAIAGLPADAVPEQAIRAFMGFFVAKPATIDTSAGWCYRLVQWVKRERVKALGQGKAPDFDDTSWANDLGDL
ncbi:MULTISPECIES: helix-turn-helix domain-containing protein [Pseudomonas]|uniref:Helix-turn-helix domain-containing protein n=1 Tax=Pseudomonas rhodesiae TaxID=76760 RepID=A0A8I1E4I2_9PSED|nr:MULTISPECIES: helix-turn-helix domain-containing protein [Pseudomonas]MBI6600587.1 helix-turn-helix domain-containing protein [Pseudomonas sp. S4_EA_1b]MBI6625330.1 helix-turn-helix domain-containing protein [Pseudomonas rhodesiae]